jgi:hypothetical protein
MVVESDLNDDITSLFEQTDTIAVAVEALSGQVEAQANLIKLLRDDIKINIESQERISSLIERGIATVIEATGHATTALTRLAQGLPSLQEHVIDFTFVVDEALHDFEGREFLLVALEEFTSQQPCGYFRIVADAGLGKTSIAARMAQHFKAPAFFFQAQVGLTRSRQCLNHLCAQLIAKFNLIERYPRLPDGAGDSGLFLQSLLMEIVQERSANVPVVIVIDGLDEADPLQPGHNWLHLPDRLPEGVYFVLTHRPGEYPITVARDVGLRKVTLAWDDAHQQADIAAYLQRQAEREPIRLACQAISPPVSVEDFVSKLQEASQGNFMYLRYVLDDIRAREIGYDPLDLTTLPHGLSAYYERFWAQMKAARDAEGWAEWKELYEPVLGLLAAARETVTVEWLAQHIGRDATEIREQVLDRWQRFLSCDTSKAVDTWRIVHQSFSDYLSAKMAVRDYHNKIAQSYISNLASRAAHDGYAQRQLSAHLVLAGNREGLFSLMDSPAWYEVQMGADPSGALYLNDVAQSWSLAEMEVSEALARGQAGSALGREVSCALATTSLHSLSGTIPPALLSALVGSGLWKPLHALATIRQRPDEWYKAHTLSALAPHLPAELHKEAVAIAQTIPNLEVRCRALTSLIPYVQEAERLIVSRIALEAAKAITDVRPQVRALVGLEPHLPDSLLEEALQYVRNITLQEQAPIYIATLVAYLPKREQLPVLNAALELATAWSMDMTPSRFLHPAPRLRGAQWEAMLRAALQAVCRVPATIGFGINGGAGWDPGVPMGWNESRALSLLAPYLSSPLLEEALSAVRAITDAGARARCLLALRTHLPADTHQSILYEALESVRHIALIYDRVNMLTKVAREMPADEQLFVLREALDIARTLQNRDDWERELTTIVPSLTEYRTLISQDEALVAIKAMLQGSSDDAMPVLEAYWTREERLVLLRETLATLQRIGDTVAQVEALALLAPHIQNVERHQMLQRAIALAQSLAPNTLPFERVEALTALLPQLNDDGRLVLLDDILDTAKRLNPARLDHVLTPLIPYIPQEKSVSIVRGLVAAFRRDHDLGSRATALAEVVPLLSKQDQLSVQQTTMAAIGEIGIYHFEGHQRRVALEMLSPYLPASLLRKGITLARAIVDPDERACALSAIALYLLRFEQEPVFEEALLLAGEADHTGARTETLAIVLSHLAQSGRWREALSRARVITYKPVRAKALMSIAVHAPVTDQVALLAETLHAIRLIEEPAYRAMLLTSLAPLIPEDERQAVAQEALTVLQAVDPDITANEVTRDMITRLLPYLSVQDRAIFAQRLLAGTWELPVVSDRHKWLLRLASYLAELPIKTAHIVWQDSLHRLASKSRKEMLPDLGALAPLLQTLGGPAAVADTAESILRSADRWP